eukprot:3916849-Amphidinium_carterae.1
MSILALWLLWDFTIKASLNGASPDAGFRCVAAMMKLQNVNAYNGPEAWKQFSSSSLAQQGEEHYTLQTFYVPRRPTT